MLTEPMRHTSLALCLFLVLLSLPVPAPAVDYPWFSLDLPPQWRAERPSRTGETWSVQLVHAEGRCQISILAGTMAGPPDARDVAGLLRAAAQVQEQPRRVDGRWCFSGKNNHNTAVHCVVSAAPDKGLFLAVLIHGDAALALPVLQAMRSKEHQELLPPLSLYTGQ